MHHRQKNAWKKKRKADAAKIEYSMLKSAICEKALLLRKKKISVILDKSVLE